MKNSLLDTFLKTMNVGQRHKGPESLNREGIKPLFLEASFERNTKSFIKYNKEAKSQYTSIPQLAKEIISLKREVVELKSRLREFGEESTDSYKVDSWARQEIQMIKKLLESRPPPLEDAPIEIKTHSIAQLQGLNAMRILPVKFQKYHV